MKKLFTLLSVAGILAFTACGPSAEEKAAKEKAVKDSIAADVAVKAAQAMADSTAKYAEEMKAKMVADSISDYKAKKAEKKAAKKEAPKKEAPKAEAPKHVNFKSKATMKKVNVSSTPKAEPKLDTKAH